MNCVLGIELWTSSVEVVGCSLDSAVQGLGTAENRAGPARLVAGHGYRGPPSSRAGRGRDWVLRPDAQLFDAVTWTSEQIMAGVSVVRPFYLLFLKYS
jgi:hypothetical protein